MSADTVSCNGTTYPLREVLLKDHSGTPLLTLTGKLTNSLIYAYDSTHPFSRCHVVETVESIVAQGSNSYHPQLLKVDFIDFAAMEAVHYDVSVASTGMAAYNLALRQVWEAVDGRMLSQFGCSGVGVGGGGGCGVGVVVLLCCCCVAVVLLLLPSKY